MKRFWNIVLVAAVLVGCSKKDIVGEMELIEIAFGSTFVDNATRSIDPSFTQNSNGGNLNEFKVWGFVHDYTGKMFDGELVTKQNDGSWRYTNTQFWIPNNTYYFNALSTNYNEVIPAASDAAKYGLGIVDFINTDGTDDLIYSSVTRSTNNLTNANETASVDLTFNHLLSKVRFTFYCGFENLTNRIAVEDVTMEVPRSAQIDLAVPNWKDAAVWTNHSSAKTILSFGNMVAPNEKTEKEAIRVNHQESPAVSNYERFTIPAGADVNYDVYFTVNLYVNELLVYSQAFKTEIKGTPLEKGKAYNFKAILGPENIGPNGPLEPIKFSVEKVNGWDDAPNNN